MKKTQHSPQINPPEAREQHNPFHLLLICTNSLHSNFSSSTDVIPLFSFVASLFSSLFFPLFLLLKSSIYPPGKLSYALDTPGGCDATVLYVLRLNRLIPLVLMSLLIIIHKNNIVTDI